MPHLNIFPGEIEGGDAWIGDQRYFTIRVSDLGGDDSADIMLTGAAIEQLAKTVEAMFAAWRQSERPN